MTAKRVLCFIVLIIIFVGIGMVVLISGVNERNYGLKFQKEATEGFVIVDRRDTELRVHRDSDGNTRTTTEYYLYLDTNEIGFQQIYKKHVSSSVYKSVSEGSKIQVFYIPEDSEHIALELDEYMESGRAGIIAGIILIIFVVGAGIWVIVRY